MSLTIQLKGRPEQLIREHAIAKETTYASQVKACIYYALEPDRGQTITRPFGKVDDPDCVRLEGIDSVNIA